MGAKGLTSEESAARNARIAADLQNGMSREEAAKKNGLSISTIYANFRRMGLDRRSATRKRGREQMIMDLAATGKTLQEIGDVCGVSRERIRQILNMLASEGQPVVRPQSIRSAKYVGLTTVMGKIGGPQRMEEWMDRGIITPVAIGNAVYITRDELAAALALWKQMKAKCTVCGKELASTKARYCKRCGRTPESNRERHRERLAKETAGEVDHKSELHGQIRQFLFKNDRCDVPFGEALTISGLTKMQLCYAKRCGLISTQRTGARSGTGEVCLYSSGEMRQIARIRESRSMPRHKNPKTPPAAPLVPA